MKKIKNINLSYLTAVILLFAVLISCKKDVETIAVIKVRDIQNQPVDKCMVVLYGHSTENKPASVAVFDTTFTNVYGEAEFNMSKLYKSGQAGVAILDINARKGTAVGKGIIKIEEEKTTEATVFIAE